LHLQYKEGLARKQAREANANRCRKGFFTKVYFHFNNVLITSQSHFYYYNFLLRGDQERLFKLVTLDRILNRITEVTSGCWWLVVVNAIPISDICQINQQNISSYNVINNPIKKCS
jgi:hypothetical protein